MKAVLGSRTRASIAALFGAVVVLALLGGCSNAGSSNGVSGSAAGGAGARAGKAAAPQEQGNAAQAAASNAPLQKRDIVRTATIKLRTRNVDRTADEIVALAGPAGGRVDGDDRSSHDKTRSATLVLRVPPAALNRIIGRIDAMGTETSRSVHGQDVTARRADVKARTASLQTSVDRLRTLMSHSGTISGLVRLENQLTRRESDLESMQAQQRALNDKIALATLTVELSAPRKPAANPHTAAAGIGDAFVSGWQALVTTARWALRIVGYSLPITAVLVLAAGAFTLFWRRRHTVTGPTADTES